MFIISKATNDDACKILRNERFFYFRREQVVCGLSSWLYKFEIIRMMTSLQRNKKIKTTQSKRNYPPAQSITESSASGLCEVKKSRKSNPKKSLATNEEVTLSLGSDSEEGVQLVDIPKPGSKTPPISFGDTSSTDDETRRERVRDNWSDRNDEIFQKYYEQGMNEPKNHPDLVKKCADETGKTLLEVLVRFLNPY